MKNLIERVKRYRRGEIWHNCLKCHKKTWHIFLNRKTCLDIMKSGSPIKQKGTRIVFVEPKPRYYLLHEDSYECEKCGRRIHSFEREKTTKEEANEFKNRNKK